MGDVIKELFLEVALRSRLALVDEGEQILEHAAGSARSGLEFLDHCPTRLEFLPELDALGLLLGVEARNALADSCGSLEFKPRETSLKTLELSLDDRLGNALAGHQLLVFFVKHNGKVFKFCPKITFLEGFMQTNCHKKTKFAKK